MVGLCISNMRMHVRVAMSLLWKVSKGTNVIKKCVPLFHKSSDATRYSASATRKNTMYCNEVIGLVMKALM